MILTVVR